MKHGLITVIYN